MPRVVVLGCGTGVGKTRVGVAIVRALSCAGQHCSGLKPIESGIEVLDGVPPVGSDAHSLSTASSRPENLVTPLYALPTPVSPHLAAREAGIRIDLNSVSAWVGEHEELTTHIRPHTARWFIIETAGGVFSPVSEVATNFDLALALEPATWVLVAADSLGVLHDVTATLHAMRALGRSPDHLVLCAARTPDRSTGTNARELELLGIARPTAVLARDDDSGVQGLLSHLIEQVHAD